MISTSSRTVRKSIKELSRAIKAPSRSVEKRIKRLMDAKPPLYIQSKKELSDAYGLPAPALHLLAKACTVFQEPEETQRRELRRRFAIAALSCVATDRWAYTATDVAKRCWALADAMLETESR